MDSAASQESVNQMPESGQSEMAAAKNNKAAEIKKDKFLNLAEASQLAGVSSSTIMRFAEAGYFRIYNRNSENHFAEQEIADVFGASFNSSRVRETTASPKTQEASNVEESSLGTDPVEPQSKDSPAQPATLQSQIEVIIENESSAEPEKIKEPLEPFKKVLQLQEELIAQKNSVISDLIKERDWLRARLEKMEEKSERDQMLLMVESQKVRTLIAAPEDVKQIAAPDGQPNEGGILKRALNWLNS